MFNIILGIQAFSILVLFLETIYVFFKLKTRGQLLLFLFCFCTLLNNIGYFYTMQTGNMDTSMVTIQFSYVGKVWIPVSFLAMVIYLCFKEFPRKIYFFLAAIHLSVLLLVLTCNYHNLYYTDVRTWVSTGLFPHMEMGHAPIYTIYMILCILYLITGLSIMIVKISQKNTVKERGLYLYLLSAIISMGAGYIVYLLHLTRGYDSTNLSYAVTSLILFIVISKYNLMDNLALVKESIPELISDGILITDTDDRLVYYNPVVKNFFSEIDSDTETTINYVKDLAENRTVFQRDENLFMIISRPVNNVNNFRGKFYLISDITSQHKYTKELEEQKELAEAANAQKSAFLSVVSHEIRTPMTAIVGMTDLILRDKGNLTPKQEKFLNNIKHSGNALVMIVNDILDQSKIQAGKMELVEDAYELQPLIDDIRLIIENRIGSKPVHLMFDIDENIPKALIGDSLRIRQILVNLMNNAVKFTEEGYIKLSIQCLKLENGRKKLKFTVKDSGMGIKKEDLARLGEAFTQVDTKKNHNKEGTGLGLSISKDFIQMMGGQLEVASTYGEGTEFFFSIWQGIATSKELSGTNNKQAWKDDVNFTAPQAKILIVDDAELNLMVVEGLLKQHNINADMASSGEKAIELVKQNHYDMIFMDYMMPYMDGIEATGHIRALGETEKEKEYYRSVPIIAFSGDDSDRTREKFQRAGIDDYTVKPVDPKHLKKMVVKWLPEEIVSLN